jgi:predicted transcriptional regulator of viral defense system
MATDNCLHFSVWKCNLSKLTVLAEALQMTGLNEKRKRLFDIASPQFGLFTAKQAVEAGYNRKHFHQKVEGGEWSKELRGLFSLVNFPLYTEQEYMKWLLWSRNRADSIQGCLSHETALFIHKLGGLMPSKIHMTVPRDFRRSNETPGLLKLHSENLGKKSLHVENVLILTTPTKTLEDLITEGRTDRELLKESLSKALETVMITRNEFNESELLKSLTI